MNPARDEPRDMSDVREEERADLISDLFKRCEINDARISRGPTDDQLWLVLSGEASDLIHVDPVVFATESILSDIEKLT